MLRRFLASTALAIAALTGTTASTVMAQVPCENCPGGYAAHGNYLGHGRHHGLGHGRNPAPGYYPGQVSHIGNKVVNDNVGYHDYAGPAGCRTCNAGNCQYRYYGQPDLFYNYYVPPNCGGVGAELYLSPRPVPAHVGHTYITYQPLYPHEFLYEHHRTYHRYYNGGQGLTRTHVAYWHSPFTSLRWW